MKKKLFAFVIFIFMIQSVSAEARLPDTYAEFYARYQTEGRTYYGALKMYFEAVFVYMNNSMREEGEKMLRYSLHSQSPIERSPSYSTFSERLKDPAYHHIFRSFAAGSSPRNNYAMNPDDFELVFAGQPQWERDYLKVPLISSGADSPRMVWMKEFENGLWFVTNNASTYVGIKPAR
ncbi:MAG: hypothetical protein IJG34_03910 [Synergistaceae bacterium]|nr:hypothetical protein [Synergistaceae bacterium]MBQ3449023.1 hypothetical protein [Synergistaceae bacterium]MBQ3694717.1 hypothetical protein [Synergistaceae bacterium]MBQ6111617.1 hypothetical protein [Synergistaceae bacterium]MBQ9628074.1 hypothetical protein [Synergistaceae bacterium]